MIKVASEADRVLVAKVHDASQDHIFDLWESLSEAEQNAFLTQLHTLDFPRVRRLIGLSEASAGEGLETRVLQPAPFIALPRNEDDRARRDAARTAGEEALRKGQIAVVTAAGETRPGQEALGPRGLIPVGPVSGKTIFQLHAEAIRASARRFRAAIPWVIVTSAAHHGALVGYLRAQEYFGLNSADVSMLTQDELPIVNRRGKFLLADRGRIAMSPNGHGGVLLRILEDDVFPALELRGIRHIFYFQADNPMVRIADPVFAGYHVLGDFELTSKAVCKLDPDEEVGIFCHFGGVTGVVEYNELSARDRTRRDAEGRLEFSAANIAIHIFSMEFLRRLRTTRSEFPVHFAQRKTSYLDRKGNRVQPRSANSIQFQSYIFDALPLARSTLILETQREGEFSPVKSLTGAASAATARRHLSRMYTRWLGEAGAEIQLGDEPDPGAVEVSPLFALDAEELKAKLPRPFAVRDGTYLE